MRRDELEPLSKAELVELVLRPQRPERTSRTSSKPPSTDRKERRERAKPAGAKPGHAGHIRPLSDDASERIAHRPDVCPCCRMALARDLPIQEAGVWKRIELPAIRPQMVHHHRLAVRCSGCAMVYRHLPNADRGSAAHLGRGEA
jgi:transposase